MDAHVTAELIVAPGTSATSAVALASNMMDSAHLALLQMATESRIPVDEQRALFGILYNLEAAEKLVEHASAALREQQEKSPPTAAIGGICADGYVRLGEHAIGELYAHRFIYKCVHGSIPAGHYVDHKNGCKSDNRISNLEAVTPSENMLRAFERGACQVGEQVAHSKLTVALVREIRRTARTVPPRDWAVRLSVHPRTIREARDGTTWRHVPMRGRLPRKPVWRRPH